MDTKDRDQFLLKSIEKDVQLCAKLLTLLKEERAALESRNIEALEAINEPKEKALNQLAENQKSRDKIQVSENLPVGFEGLKQLLASLPSSKNQVLDKALEELKNLLMEVEKLNLINAKFIAVNHAQITHILNIMCGRNENIYGEKAESISTETSRTITKV